MKRNIVLKVLIFLKFVLIYILYLSIFSQYYEQESGIANCMKCQAQQKFKIIPTINVFIQDFDKTY